MAFVATHDQAAIRHPKKPNNLLRVRTTDDFLSRERLQQAFQQEVQKSTMENMTKDRYKNSPIALSKLEAARGRDELRSRIGQRRATDLKGTYSPPCRPAQESGLRTSMPFLNRGGDDNGRAETPNSAQCTLTGGSNPLGIVGGMRSSTRGSNGSGEIPQSRLGTAKSLGSVRSGSSVFSSLSRQGDNTRVLPVVRAHAARRNGPPAPLVDLTKHENIWSSIVTRMNGLELEKLQQEADERQQRKLEYRAALLQQMAERQTARENNQFQKKEENTQVTREFQNNVATEQQKKANKLAALREMNRNNQNEYIEHLAARDENRHEEALTDLRLREDRDVAQAEFLALQEEKLKKRKMSNIQVQEENLEKTKLSAAMKEQERFLDEEIVREYGEVTDQETRKRERERYLNVLRKQGYNDWFVERMAPFIDTKTSEMAQEEARIQAEQEEVDYRQLMREELRKERRSQEKAKINMSRQEQLQYKDLKRQSSRERAAQMQTWFEEEADADRAFSQSLVPQKHRAQAAHTQDIDEQIRAKRTQNLLNLMTPQEQLVHANLIRSVVRGESRHAPPNESSLGLTKRPATTFSQRSTASSVLSRSSASPFVGAKPRPTKTTAVVGAK